MQLSKRNQKDNKKNLIPKVIINNNVVSRIEVSPEPVITLENKMYLETYYDH
jgi:hypothetical protein